MANERKLRILIDSSSARKGGKEVTKEMGRVVASGKQAIATFKELQKVMTSLNVSNSGKTYQQVQKVIQKQVGTTDDLTKATVALIKARQKLENTMYAEQARTQALGEAIGKNSVRVQEQRRLTEELARSKERLNMVNSKEYSELIRTRKAIEDRNKQIRMMNSDIKKSTISVSGLQSAFSTLGTVMAGLAVYFSVGAIARTADEYTNITNKLKAVSDATVDTTNATRDLLDLSIESRSSLQGTMEIYSKMTRVNEDLGKSQREVRDLTEAVSKAVAMSGASVQGAQGALMQFAQAMSGDFKSSGQELNSILEQTPMLAVAMAKGLREVTGDATITASSLKRMAAAGELSTELVFEALLKILPKLRKQFESTDQTMASAAEGLQSSFTVMLGELDKTYGTSEAVVDIMKDLGKAMTENGDTILAFSAALAGMVGAAALGGLIAILAAVGPVILSVVGVVGLLTGGIASAYLESVKYENQLNSLIKTNKKLRESTDDYAESIGVLSSAKIQDAMAATQKQISTAESELSGLKSKMKELQSGSNLTGRARRARNNQNLSEELLFNTGAGKQFKDISKLSAESEENIRLLKLRIDSLKEGLSDAKLRDFSAAFSHMQGVISNLDIGKDDKALAAYMKDIDAVNTATTKALDKAAALDDTTMGMMRHNTVTTDSLKGQAIALDKYIKSVPTLLTYLDEEKAKTDETLASQLENKNNLIEINSIYKANTELLKVQADKGLINKDQLKDQLALLKQQNIEAKKLSVRNSSTGFLGGIQAMFETGINWKNIGDVIGSGIGSYLTDLLVQEGGNSKASGQLGTAGAAIGSIWGPAGSAIGQAAGSVLGAFVDEVTIDFAKIQAEQFTGEILGSNKEQTKSLVSALSKIEKLTDTMLGINRDMLTALKNTQSGIKNVTDSFVSSNYNFANTGADSKHFSLLGKIFGGSSSVSDEGINILGDSITNLMESSIVQAYRTVKTRPNWWSSTRTTTSIDDISRVLSSPISEVMKSIGDVMIASGNALGYTSKEIEGLMSQVNIATLSISTKDMNADQINEAFSSYFSSVFNTVSDHVFSFVKSFQVSGEAFGDTLTRLTTNFQTVNQVLSMMGQSGFGKGTATSLTTANNVIDALGGADRAASTWMNFFGTFASDADQFTYTQDALTDSFKRLGMTLPETREGLWAYVKTLNLSNTADQERLGLITSLTDSLDTYYSNIEEVSSEISEATDRAFSGIIDWLNEIRGTSTEGYQSLQVAQAQFQTQLALARSGNTEALSTITDYADSVLEAAERSAGSGDQYRSIKDSIVNSVGGIPKFANGGFHSGGLRLVGENGPELEYTGSSNIYNNDQMSRMFNTTSLERGISSLEQNFLNSFNRLVEITYGGFMVLSKNSKVMSDYMQVWDSEGLSINDTTPIKVEVA